MDKKLIERIGMAAVIAAFVAYFCYQVAYGTNESSYQVGYKSGKEGYACSNYESDCDNGLGACQVGLKIGYNNDVRNIGGDVTNQTACDDGFVNGWKQWCNTDLSLCAKYFLGNIFPGQLANNQTYYVRCLKYGDDNINVNDTSNILSPLTKHCPAGPIVDDVTPWKVIKAG
jgi:hypothetical protein